MIVCVIVCVCGSCVVCVCALSHATNHANHANRPNPQVSFLLPRDHGLDLNATVVILEDVHGRTQGPMELLAALQRMDAGQAPEDSDSMTLNRAALTAPAPLSTFEVAELPPGGRCPLLAPAPAPAAPWGLAAGDSDGSMGGAGGEAEAAGVAGSAGGGACGRVWGPLRGDYGDTRAQ